MDPPPTSEHRERIAVLALTLFGASVRLWGFPRLGLQHFDEGIYALVGLWPFDRRGLGVLSESISYAPPGFPILVGLAFAVLGPSDLAAIAISEACGILTIPVVAWLGRRTFGPGAGASAAALASLAGPHVAFSRMALTDAPFLLSWLLALGLGGRFLERPGFLRAIGLGVAVGVAQNVKYNGGLTGVIVALAAVAGPLVSAGDRRLAAVSRTFGWGTLAALVAALVYLPWYRFVDAHGGYAALMAHHRGYLGTLETWPDGWHSQLAQGVALSGGIGWTGAAWGLAWIGAGRVLGANDRAKAALGLLLGILLFWAFPSLPWWAGLAWSPWLIASPLPGRRVVGTWWIVMSVLTPFYHPYARLWLPLHAAGWIVVGGSVASFWRMQNLHSGSVADDRSSDPVTRPGLMSSATGWLTLCILLMVAEWTGGPARPRPLSGLLAATCDQRVSLPAPGFVPPPKGGVLRILARPTARFYLGLRGDVPLQASPNLPVLLRGVGPGDRLLIDEFQLRQEEGVDRLLLHQRWAEVPGGVWLERLNLPTLLDLDPGAAFGDDSARIVRWRLMRP